VKPVIRETPEPKEERVVQFTPRAEPEPVVQVAPEPEIEEVSEPQAPAIDTSELEDALLRLKNLRGRWQDFKKPQ